MDGNISIAHCMPLTTRLKRSRLITLPAFKSNFNLLWPWPLTSWTTTSTVHVISPGTSCANLYWNWFINFQNIAFTSWWQTNGWTGREHYACCQSRRRADKNSTCSLADDIAVMCFYNAKCILSEIAKFLVQLLWEKKGQGEVKGRWGKGRKWERPIWNMARVSTILQNFTLFSHRHRNICRRT